MEERNGSSGRRAVEAEEDEDFWAEAQEGQPPRRIPAPLVPRSKRQTAQEVAEHRERIRTRWVFLAVIMAVVALCHYPVPKPAPGSGSNTSAAPRDILRTPAGFPRNPARGSGFRWYRR